MTAEGGPPLVRVPAGKFWMGSPEGEGDDDERPRHLVLLPEFLIDRHPVTAAQFADFCRRMGRPAPQQPPWSADDHPVVNVSWEDARDYCAWAGKRLPTEAEWERAARGGTQTRYYFGDDEGGLGEYAWFRGNSGGQTHPVAGKAPNAFGLYDMHGNVWEWVADWYDPGYYARSPASGPRGPEAGVYRVLRGGSWSLFDVLCRCAARNRLLPRLSGLNLGFRCARDTA
ncbi:MAG: formylglycine-generating enzyme family protein [Elusimicrobia bacterium]|nr:formylglycine-generating enzyme family protein [Elusimicrobiota bacterium]